MKSSNESPPSNQPMKGAAPGTAKPKPAVEPPTQPFINLSGDGPVDPTKFQCFVLPQEFIEKANAVELPRVNPDDFTDSEPPRPPTPERPRAGNAHDENRAMSRNMKRSAKSDAATQPELKAQPRAEYQDTVMIHRRRKSALIPKELLEAAAHPQAKAKRAGRTWALLGLVGVVVLLIWFWSRGNEGSDDETSVRTEGSAAVPAAPRVVGDVPAVPTVASAASAASAIVVQPRIAPEALPEVVDIDKPEGLKAKPVKNGVTTVPKATTERTPRSNANVAVPAPAASAPIKGVIPVIEPE